MILDKASRLSRDSLRIRYSEPLFFLVHIFFSNVRIIRNLFSTGFKIFDSYFTNALASGKCRFLAVP